MRYNPAFLNSYAAGQSPDPEVMLAQRYRSEIQSLLADINVILPTYRKRADRKTHNLVCENLKVLTTCFDTDTLNVQALGVLRDHLWMLLRTLNYTVAKAEN